MMAAWQSLFFMSLLLAMMIFIFRSFNHHHLFVFLFLLASSMWGALVTITFYYRQPTWFPLPAEP